MKKSKLFWSLTLVLAILAIAYLLKPILKSKPTLNNKPLNYTYKIVNQYPHDPEAFTQGLIFADGYLYESTGLYGKSSLRNIDLKTGNILREIKLAPNVFGEGITLLNNKIYLLTWKAKKGFIYDKETFQQTGSFTYPHDGWGLTNDGKNLIMSNGSSYIYFLEPKLFNITKKIKVIDQGEPVNQLNELEFINGKIYANIWRSNKIITIDPISGNVLEWINLSGILKKTDYKKRIDVLNGIAYDNINKRLFITGKLWPKLFEVELIRE